MGPRLSIGMPIYNGERYLREAIDSILSQSYGDFELIICDNASTDRTQEICTEYANRDGRIRYYRNPKNLGAAPNFNRTFELSSGEYFKWSAADDAIAPDCLARCVEVLDREPNVVLCSSKTRLIDAHGVTLGEHSSEGLTDSPKPTQRFSKLALTPHKCLQVHGLMHKSILSKTGLMRSFPCSDHVFLAELALYGEFYEIPDTLFYIREHDGQSNRGELSKERDRVAFEDTSMQNQIVLPKWLYLRGYLQAIRNAPLNNYERTYCRMQMIRWCLKPDHARALTKDFVLAMNSVLVPAQATGHK